MRPFQNAHMRPRGRICVINRTDYVRIYHIGKYAPPSKFLFNEVVEEIGSIIICSADSKKVDSESIIMLKLKNLKVLNFSAEEVNIKEEALFQEDGLMKSYETFLAWNIVSQVFCQSSFL